MTDPISIPILYRWTDTSGDHSRITGYADITPEIQAQILAPLVDRIAVLERHWHHTRPERTALPVTDDGPVIPIPSPVAADKPAEVCNLAIQRVRTIRECDTPIPGLIRDVAYWKDRAEKAEQLQECLRQIIQRTVNVFEGEGQPVKECIDYIRAEMEILTDRKVLIFSDSGLMRERDAARAEADTLKRQLQDVANARREDQDRMVQLVDERDALKARKVTLKRDPDITKSYQYHDGYNVAMDAAYAAIRAAGVEVES